MDTLAKYTKEIEQDVCALSLMLTEEKPYYIDGLDMSQFFGRDVKVSSGANKNAIIFDNYVLKFSRSHTNKNINNDYKAYKNYVGTWAEEFIAETHLIKCMGHSILVQESVGQIGSDKFSKNYDKLQQLFRRMNYEDGHIYNLGWKTIGGLSIPKIIDFEYCWAPKKDPFTWR